MAQVLDFALAFAAADAFGRFSTHAMYQSWVRACKTVKKNHTLTPADRRMLDEARPYDLHHTFGTFLLLQTQNLSTTKELMRHRSTKTTKRYAGAAVHPTLRAARRASVCPHTSRRNWKKLNRYVLAL